MVLLLALGTARAADGPQVPLALAWGADGMLRVALRDARQVATVDPRRWEVVGRRALPFRPASLAFADDRATLFVGGMGGEVLAVRPSGATLLAPADGRGPTRVLALGGSRLAAASPWGASVRVIDGVTGRVVRAVDVPFPAGAMVRRSDGRLIVADAFGDQIADLDPETGRVRTRTLDGVNLRALAVSGDGKELLIGHMVQDGDAPVTRANVDAGRVLSSRLSAVRLTEFDADGRDGEAVARRRLTLDGAGHGAADPSALAVSRDGAVVLVAFSGAHQLLKNDRALGAPTADAPDLLPLGHSLRLELLEVGRSPADVALDPSGAVAVTADAMSDTLTAVRVADLSVAATVRLGSGSPARTAGQRGEAHFLDGRRALDRWMSCASCHPGGHTHGLNFDTLGDGGYGAAKNTPSLLGAAPNAPFAWTGRFPDLAGQVRQSLQTSLHGPPPDDAAVDDLTAYLRSLSPPPPRRSPDDPAARRGGGVFQARRCQTCHKPPSYTSVGVKDVGLDDGPGGHRAFNPPSLLGVGRTAPYLHDGRAPDLDAVLDVHPPGQKTPLSPADRADLIAFLESL